MVIRHYLHFFECNQVFLVSLSSWCALFTEVIERKINVLVFFNLLCLGIPASSPTLNGNTLRSITTIAKTGEKHSQVESVKSSIQANF